MAKKQFKAESKRLLDLMINSIYTHKEIFLREIISNASDAIDKLAYKALTDDKVGLNRSDFQITLIPDEDGAHPHRRGQRHRHDQGGAGEQPGHHRPQRLPPVQGGDGQAEEGAKGDTDIIGQFGVGFYSAFMVADRVTVTSRAYGQEEAWQWESAGADGYTLTPCEKADGGHRHRHAPQGRRRGGGLRRVPGARAGWRSW